MRKLSNKRKYLKQQDREDIERYIEAIEGHLGDIQYIARGFIDNEEEVYQYDYKDYARIDDKLVQIYNAVHYLREVVKK